MPIKKSIEDLPRSNHEQLGTKPSAHPFIGEALANRLLETEDENHPKDLALAIPEAGAFRASYASKRCNRALWYALTDTPKSNPPDAASFWQFKLGHTVHDLVQEIAPDLFPDGDVEIEPAIDLRPIGVEGSAHADMVMTYKGKRVLVEMKSINGFGFKRAATTFSGPPEGPRSGHVIQAGLAAWAYDCDAVCLVYFSLENVSVRMAATYSDTPTGRFTAEWHYTVEELKPMLETEVKRINGIMSARNADRPQPRALVDHGIPEGALIQDPESGMWTVVEGRAITNTGDTWMCGYCDYKDKCISDGAS